MMDGHCRFICPVHCAPGEQLCAGLYFDSDGCPTEDQCVPEGAECPEPMYDPMGCEIFSPLVEGQDYDPEYEMLCDYDYDHSTVGRYVAT